MGVFMATNPSGLNGALFDPQTSNGLGGITSGLGYGTNQVYSTLPAGIETNEQVALPKIGTTSPANARPCGYPTKSAAVKVASGTVANGGVVVTGFTNRTGKTITSGQAIVAVEA